MELEEWFLSSFLFLPSKNRVYHFERIRLGHVGGLPFRIGWGCLLKGNPPPRKTTTTTPTVLSLEKYEGPKYLEWGCGALCKPSSS